MTAARSTGPRDFRREIVAAVQANDVAALAGIAHNLLGRVEADDERRSRQAGKKRKERDAKHNLVAVSRDVAGQPGTSLAAEMSLNVAGRPGTSGDVAGVVPPLRSTTTTTPPPSAQVIAKLGDERLQQTLDRVKALVADVPDGWEDVAGFFLRRKYSAWQAWADLMTRDVGMASQYTPPDLAQVCRDDGTLDKRIGSGGIFRTFLAKARSERVELSRPPPPSSGPARRDSRGRASIPAGIPTPLADPDTAPKWQT